MWDTTECKIKPLCSNYKTKDTCTSDADSLQCSWSDAKGCYDSQGCAAHDASITCEAAKVNLGTDKQYNKCTWTPFNCQPKPVKEATPCGSYGAEFECNSVARCQFKKDPTAQEGDPAYCQDKEIVKPEKCSSFSEETTCPTDRCVFKPDNILTKCEDKKCSAITDQTACNAYVETFEGGDKCHYNTAAKKCLGRNECATYGQSNMCNANDFCYIVSFKECAQTQIELNWDKEEVIREAWYNKTLFEIGGVKITAGMSVYTMIAIIVVALLISAITSYVAYQKRDKIAEEMRRASEYARKASLKIRASISGRPQ